MQREMKKSIEEFIWNFVALSPHNRMREGGDEKIWRNPLVGVSRGDDPLFDFLKEDIGEFLWTPLEAFGLAFPHLSASADEVSVISWVLPQSDATHTDHAKERAYPSERWVRARVRGEDFNDRLRRELVSFFLARDVAAVAPVLSPLWSRQSSAKYGFASNWSERHAAYISGLGTFGLSDGLITPEGKAVRCGSVVARVVLPADRRPYSHHQAYCLFHARGTCAKCARRCPAGAISRAGHDKVACHAYIRNVTKAYAQREYGLAGNACGLCQVGVPCAKKIPRPTRAAS